MILAMGRGDTLSIYACSTFLYSTCFRSGNNVTEELLLCVKLAMCVATLLSASVLLELSAVAAPP